MDESLFRTKLAATAKHLDEAARQAQPASPAAYAAAGAELRRAGVAVAELVRLCAGEPEVRQRDCPACAKTVMSAARLCGFCWTKLTPVA
jgi:hypothetical protein